MIDENSNCLTYKLWSNVLIQPVPLDLFRDAPVCETILTSMCPIPMVFGIAIVSHFVHTTHCGWCWNWFDCKYDCSDSMFSLLPATFVVLFGFHTNQIVENNLRCVFFCYFLGSFKQKCQNEHSIRNSCGFWQSTATTSMRDWWHRKRSRERIFEWMNEWCIVISKCNCYLLIQDFVYIFIVLFSFNRNSKHS